MKCEDLSDQKFGLFTVIERIGSDNWGRATWSCTCQCGSQKAVASHNLKSGSVISCGCSRRGSR